MYRNRTWKMALCLAAMLSCASLARADYEAGQTAWQAGRHAEAVTQWREAARAGDGKAMLALGRAFARGLGVPQDYILAHMWLNLAAGRGSAEAARERDGLAANMIPQHIASAQERARAWLSGRGAGAPKSAAVPRAAAPSAPAGPPPPRAIRKAQGLMAALGYNPGAADGRWGPRTAKAYATFLRDAGLPPGNGLTPEALRTMRSAAKGRNVAASAAAPRPAPATQRQAASPPANLHRLVAAGDVEGVKAALAHGADANARDAKGWTPLMHVADKGQALLVPLLLKAGADPNSRLADGATALFIATVHGHSGIVDKLVAAGADPKIEGPGGNTAEKLIARRTAKKKYDYGPGALHEALQANESPAIIKAMLDLGADPNELNKDGYTPLFWLAEQDYGGADNDLIELLVKSGADVNFRYRNLKVTPLHVAAGRGKSSFVAALLKHGAEVNSADHEGATPLYWLADNGPVYTDLVEIAKQLLDRGADVNRRKNSGFHSTPFEISLLSCRRTKLSKFLLSRGTDVGQRRGKKGRLNPTALHFAAGHGCGTELVGLLLSKGLDVNVQDYEGRTPLFDAVSDRQLHMVKFLLDRGADPTIQGIAQYPYLKSIPYSGYKHPRVTPLENALRARKYWKQEGHSSIAADYVGIIDLLSNVNSSNARRGNEQGSPDESLYGHGD